MSKMAQIATGYALLTALTLSCSEPPRPSGTCTITTPTGEQHAGDAYEYAGGGVLYAVEVPR